MAAGREATSTSCPATWQAQLSGVIHGRCAPAVATNNTRIRYSHRSVLRRRAPASLDRRDRGPVEGARPLERAAIRAPRRPATVPVPGAGRTHRTEEEDP
ncbi:hypothetical protein GCM10018790_78410 [Kitasatospora xanthocidica]|nr:hypothetical protein GCM10018790_78410 [Kitasatospora xanthocidica]